MNENGNSDWKLRLREFWQLCEWPVVGLLSVVALAFGYFGFSADLAAQGKPPSFWHCLYNGLQLFVLQCESGADVLPWQLNVARFLAPAAAGYTAIQALMVLFRDQLDMVRLRTWRNHVVVCGLGRLGPHLVRDLLRRGERVVAIEFDEENDSIDACRGDGAVVLVGDATDATVLGRAGVARAKHVVATTGNDSINIQISLQSHGLVSQTRRESHDALIAHTHVVHPGLSELFRKYHLFNVATDAFQIEVFSVYESSARLLFEQYPLDRDGIRPDDPRRPHLIVLGFGPTGENVLLQAAKVGHFANGKRLRVSVVDREAERSQRDFLQRYPQLDKVCDVESLPANLEEPEALDRVVHWAKETDTIASIVICFTEDFGNLSLALKLAPLLKGTGVPILARMIHDAGVATVLEGPSVDPTLKDVHGFGMIYEAATQDVVLSVKLDQLARAIHEDYREQRRKKGESIKPEVNRDWEDLAETYRASNRHQADHIPVKLRAIGCVASTAQPGKEPVATFTSDEIELLAKMEHARWNAERFLDGWTLGPRDDSRKLHPNLVPWVELPPNIQDYDRQAVVLIPHLMNLVSQKIYRNLKT